MGGRKCFGQQVWFVAHLATQWTGMILFISGFIVAFTKLEGGGSGEIKEAHESIGIAIMAAAGAQVRYFWGVSHGCASIAGGAWVVGCFGPLSWGHLFLCVHSKEPFRSVVEAILGLLFQSLLN